jgi:RNA polymerase sigma-70 factor (ECF subfamily)
MPDSRTQQFLAAYDEHADAIFRFCYAQTGRRDDARDLTQDTFARAWRHCAAGKRVDQWRPFLYRIARNAAIDLSRRARPESLDALQESGFDVRDEQARDPSVLAEATRAVRLIASLEPAYRDAVAMRYVDDMSPRDIARITGERENAVSVRIHRGLQRLRELLTRTSQ